MAAPIYRSATIIALLSLVRINIASDILLVMPMGTKSHLHFYSGVIEALADAGHKVTLISPFAYVSKAENIRLVQLQSNFADKMTANAFDQTMANISKAMVTEAPKGCIETIREEKVQAVLEEHFDLFLQPFIFADCYFSAIYEKNIPYAFVFPNTIFGPFSEMVGNIDVPSFVPNGAMQASYPMTFCQRVQSALLSVAASMFSHYYVTYSMEQECRKSRICPEEMPSFGDMQRKASLAIINSVRSLELPARPYSPTVIFAGGIHINKPGTIPRDIKEWIDESGDEGFILFSLGSVVDTSQMKENVRRTLLNAFSSLKQRVLWKWNSLEMEDLPQNVKISSWLPQQDILAHPKIRLFITHGGLLSTQEATYFGVPIVGIPVFADQHNNLAQVIAEGWGRKVDLKYISEEVLLSAIMDVLHNDSVHQIVQHRSRLMKDLPQSPAKEVVYWIEYILRHNGAKHLQSPLAHMPWHKIYNIDVWALICATTFLIITGTIYTVYFCLRKCFGTSIKNKKE